METTLAKMFEGWVHEGTAYRVTCVVVEQGNRCYPMRNAKAVVSALSSGFTIDYCIYNRNSFEGCTSKYENLPL